MTEKIFLDSVKELLANKNLYENAKNIKVQIDNENGLEKTADEIEKIHGLTI
jgi:UDP:flavonoid glycosyltransferase YjiC (YdhE family)